MGHYGSQCGGLRSEVRGQRSEVIPLSVLAGGGEAEPGAAQPMAAGRGGAAGGGATER